MRSEVWILLLAAFGVLLLVIRLWRNKRAQKRLREDRSGLWRYHDDTVHERKEPYGARLAKRKAKGETPKPIAVIHFNGDLRAKGHRDLAKLVDEVEVNREKLHSVVIVVSSPGGFVSTYGHAFSQLERIRRLEIDLTVCVDVVAASGGYLMSLPANRIIAAPFAIVGSVGVVAFVPNVRRLLQDWHVEPRTFTAGKYKRTVTLTDSATPEEVARFQGQLESMHRLFVDLLKKYRPSSKIEEIETGEHWTATESMQLNLGLVDQIATSQEYLLQLNADYPLVNLSSKKGFFEEGLIRLSTSVADEVENRLSQSLNNTGLKGW